MVLLFVCFFHRGFFSISEVSYISSKKNVDAVILTVFHLSNQEVPVHIT